MVLVGSLDSEATELQGLAPGVMFQILHILADWEVSRLDRHLLSYCMSLHNTPTEQRGCITKGLTFEVPERQKYVRMLSKENINVI